MNNCVTIIVTFNAMRWLDKCIGSLRHSNEPTDIFVIDNDSSDETVNYIKTNYPEVRLFEEKDNLGFGKANNVGLIEACKMDYSFMFLLNQDAWVEKDVLGSLKKALIANPDFGIISPIHLNGTGTDYDRLFELAVKKQLANDNFLDRGQGISTIREIDFVNAAAWMMPKECILRVGLFHPLFFHYGEDNNYVDRVKYETLKVGLLSHTYIYHDRQGRKNNQLKDDVKRKFIKDSLTMLLKPKSIARNSSVWLWALFRIVCLNNNSYLIKDKIDFFKWALNQHSQNILKRNNFTKYRSRELKPFDL
ncbi:MAG: glycosyltransferase family 2 protein [Cyclobacteriaceae bacterium]